MDKIKLLFENSIKKLWHEYITECAAEEAWELVTQPRAEIKKLIQSLELDKIPGAATDYYSFVRSSRGRALIGVIEKLPSQSINALQVAQLKNFSKKPGVENLVKDALAAQKSTEPPRQAYVNLMSARDDQGGRKRGAERLGSLYDQVVSGKCEPPVVLNINNELYVVGGRTRLYAALIANQPMKVKIINTEALGAIS